MIQQRILYFLIIGSIILRFFHLEGELDNPHTWRQSDTANYIWDYYQNGVDLAKPSVCWMGNYKTVVLEFPIFEAIVAEMYHVFGPYHAVARIVFLLFFILSCWFLYKIIRFFLSKEIALSSVFIYSIMPLSLFYSRAVHIDYAEMSLSLGMVYFYLTGYRKKNLFFLFVGSIFLTLALMVKAPYAILFAFPLLWFIYHEKSWIYALKTSPITLLALVLFLLWQHHVFQTNNAAPDWYYVPGYRKFTHNVGWYYGDFSQRLSLTNWQIIGERFSLEITGLIGLLFLFIGIIKLNKTHLFFGFWLIGCILYLLVFYNLNRVHNYYQIPFTPILAIIMAIGIFSFSNLLSNSLKFIFIFSIMLSIATENILYSENHYYKVEQLHVEIGNMVRKNTLPNDLVIINVEDFDSKCPNFHYAAKRNGWVIPEWGLSCEVLNNLINEGASYFISVRKVGFNPKMKNCLNQYNQKVWGLQDGYKAFIYKIKSN